MLPAGEDEALELAGLSPTTAPGITRSAELSQAELIAEDRDLPSHLFPVGQLDQDLQQIDLRDRNSWRLTLAEVSSVELLETQLVNAVAPFVLNARLKRNRHGRSPNPHQKSQSIRGKHARSEPRPILKQSHGFIIYLRNQ